MSNKEQWYFALAVFGGFVTVVDFFTVSDDPTKPVRVAIWLCLILFSVYKIRKIREAEKKDK